MIIYDFAFVAGIGCVTYASYQVHPALAWAVGGLSLCAFGFAGARGALKTRGPSK